MHCTAVVSAATEDFSVPAVTSLTFICRVYTRIHVARIHIVSSLIITCCIHLYPDIRVARPGYLYPATCIWCKRGFIVIHAVVLSTQSYFMTYLDRLKCILHHCVLSGLTVLITPADESRGSKAFSRVLSVCVCLLVRTIEPTKNG